VLDLDLGVLPQMAQTRTISQLAPAIWADERVVALWLGGSLARGEGDDYSDIDVRVAVDPADLEAWRALDTQALTGGQVVGGHTFALGEDALIHHLLLLNGDIVDLLVQTTARPPNVEPFVVLGCRDEMFAGRLQASSRVESELHNPATAEGVRELIVAFWVNSHKHRKVLHRSLDLMIPSGLYHSWLMLMRLWYMEATGEETSAYHFSGIHGLTQLVRSVEALEDVDARAVAGVPGRTREEIYTAIERHQQAAAHVGRLLAERYHFEYPLELERMVRAQWRAFRESE
jgi:nucleotidyltransferase-like protein